MSSQIDGAQLLCRVVSGPDALGELDGRQWTVLLATARQLRMLATLWHRAGAAGVQERLPEPVARHLWGAAQVAEHSSEALLWELAQLDQGLLQRLTPPLALKGSAYLLADLPNARGRLCVDIDLLFPRAEVERAEALLFFESWMGSHHTAYDQRYYREWMHELPPLQHIKRGTTLDLHHNILPETFAVRVDPQRIFDAAQPLAAPWRMRVPAPKHLVLHAIVHLFSETEWDRGLRDLYDIHCLVEHFAGLKGETFWDELLNEAERMVLIWLVEPALWCCQQRFATDLPKAVEERLEHYAPAWRWRWSMRALFDHGLNAHTTVTPHRDALARASLFLRGHWLKMPPLLLARHLFYKAFLAPRDAEPTANPPHQLP